MSAETEIRALLVGYAGLTALVGANGVSEAPLPQGSALPYVTFFRVSTPRRQAIGGAQTIIASRPRFQFDVYASTPTSRDAVLAQLIAALQSSSNSVSFESQRSYYDADFSPDSACWRSILDVFYAHAGA